MKMEDELFSMEYKISEGTEITKTEQEDTQEIKIDLTNYPISKAKRIIIRTKIIHD
jgi:hypothetical protein